MISVERESVVGQSGVFPGSCPREPGIVYAAKMSGPRPRQPAMAADDHRCWGRRVSSAVGAHTGTGQTTE